MRYDEATEHTSATAQYSRAYGRPPWYITSARLRAASKGGGSLWEEGWENEWRWEQKYSHEKLWLVFKLWLLVLFNLPAVKKNCQVFWSYIKVSTLRVIRQVSRHATALRYRWAMPVYLHFLIRVDSLFLIHRLWVDISSAFNRFSTYKLIQVHILGRTHTHVIVRIS